MDQELETLDEAMKNEIKIIKDKYSCLKAEVKKKYKLQKKKDQDEQKKKEKEQLKKIRKSIPKSLKILVWNKNMGKEKGIGGCYVCESEIDSKNFECGHIISVKDGGDTNLDNLLPICSSCNKSMGTQNLHEFKETYFSDSNVKIDNLTPVQEYIETKVKYNEGLVKHFTSGEMVTREVKLETIYNSYREWLNVNHPQDYKDKMYEDCFGNNDTIDELKTIMINKFGEPHNMANWCNPLERGKNILGWNNIETI